MKVLGMEGMLRNCWLLLLTCVVYLWFLGNFLAFRTDRRITETRFIAMKMFQRFF